MPRHVHTHTTHFSTCARTHLSTTFHLPSPSPLLTPTPTRGDGSKPWLYNSWVPKIDVGGRNDQILQKLYSNSNRRPLFGLRVIHEYPEEAANLSRKCHTWKDCFYSLSELISDNGEIGPSSVSTPSGPGLGFFGSGYQKIFLFFFLFGSASIPSPTPAPTHSSWTGSGLMQRLQHEMREKNKEREKKKEKEKESLCLVTYIYFYTHVCILSLSHTHPPTHTHHTHNIHTRTAVGRRRAWCSASNTKNTSSQSLAAAALR